MTEPELVEMDEFFVMGIEITTSLAREASPTQALLPRLWATFFNEQVEGKVPHRKDPNEYVGVYSDYDMDTRNKTYGQYGALAGCEVTEVDDVPEGFLAMPVPAGKYLHFAARGPMPDALVRTWGDIWRYFEENKEHERAFTVDFDLYRKDRTEEVDIFVSVK
jgi:predicted transcriptional regulator YdeE